MSEIRFNSDNCIEEKCEFLMKSLKIKTKKELFVHLLTTKYEAEKEEK